MNFQMISLFYWEALLKVNFQDASKNTKPLFPNKAILQRIVI